MTGSRSVRHDGAGGARDDGTDDAPYVLKSLESRKSSDGIDQKFEGCRLTPNENSKLRGSAVGRPQVKRTG